MRNPIQDANEGTTRIAKRSTTSAAFVHNSPGVDVDNKTDRFMQASRQLSGALDQIGDAWQASNVEDSEMRQGTEEGVNEVDKANKRTGFMKFLFGQDARYSTAVGIATKNFAQNEYLRQMQDVGNNIDKTPEEYQAYLKDSVVSKLEELYEDDPEARKIAMNQWSAQSRKLAREQTAKHMVWAAEQTHSQGIRDLTAQFDDINLNVAGSTQAAQDEAIAELNELLSPSYTYVAEDGTVASQEASRAMQVAAIEQQLSAGNTALMKSIPDNFYDGLTESQMNRMNTAKAMYDNEIARQNELIVENGLLAIEEQNIGGLKAAMKELTANKGNLSDSTKAAEQWTQSKRRLAAAYDTYRRSQIKQTAKETTVLEYYQAREMGDSGKAGQYYTKKNVQEADNAVVLVQASRWAAENNVPLPTTMAEGIDIAMANPQVMRSIAMRAHQYRSISPQFAEAIKQEVFNIKPNEDGYIAPEDMAKIDNLRLLYDKAPGEMREALGQDASALLEITMNNSRDSVLEINNKRAEYIKNKDKNVTKQELGIPSGENIHDFVRKQLGELDGAAANYYVDQLETGYKIYGRDTKAAINYMRQQFENNNKQWGDRTIKNAGLATSYDPIQILNHLEGTGMARALIEERIPAGNQDEGNPIDGFKKLNDVQMEINPGTQELIIRSSQFSFPMVYGLPVLEKLSQDANAAQKKIESELEKALLSTYEQQAQQVGQGQFHPARLNGNVQ